MSSRSIPASLWRAAAPETITTCDGATLAHGGTARITAAFARPPAGGSRTHGWIAGSSRSSRSVRALAWTAHGPPRPPAHRVPAAACRRVRNVIDHRSFVTGGMWCCHCVRAGPDRT